MNINKYTCGKIIIPGRVFFGGGVPKFRKVPHFVRWGNYLSIFWLGTELVIKIR
jgi:hypothetical protein